MTSTSLLDRPLPTPLRCCPKECDYRPEAVEHFLEVLEAFGVNGEDPTLVIRSQALSQDVRGGRVGDQAVALWDVQRVVRDLRLLGREVSSTSVARRLCPWSLEV